MGKEVRIVKKKSKLQLQVLERLSYSHLILGLKFDVRSDPLPLSRPVDSLYFSNIRQTFPLSFGGELSEGVFIPAEEIHFDMIYHIVVLS